MIIMRNLTTLEEVVLDIIDNMSESDLSDSTQRLKAWETSVS